MREGLFTGLGVKRAQSVLYGPIFSGPVNRGCFGEQLLRVPGSSDHRFR
jgi:hypothetical protein